MQVDRMDATLNELLDANAGFDLAARGTTNHCPMALVALSRMGASPSRLREFFAMWERKYALPAPRVDVTISRRDWSRQLANPAAFGALRLCFLDWMADDGPIPVITQVLSAVPFAPATGAFHALVRLAYGIEAAHAGEMAAGLAALVSSHLPIAIPVDGSRRAESVDAAFYEVARAMADDPVNGNSITARLRAVAGDARFQQAVLSPPATSSLLDDMARAAISVYWRTADFTVLHTVTGTHAARILFARLPDSLAEQLLPDLWFALCAAYATVRKPLDVEPDVPAIEGDWNEACRLAVLSDDDHVVKMTYTCLCEDRRNVSECYLASAARLVGMP
ncbi:questin oxidase family protein [Paraburkholderia sp. B3]|uniref:questin oxidase family protein n=1 Tax=Paraburkholderia sp. B3 TaxID=3134791 RepID=UPI003981EF9B